MATSLSSKSLRIAVIGGGIGGLAASIALAKRGHQVTLLEKRPALEGIGAGIILAPNAAAVLEALGVDLGERRHALPAFELHDAAGAVLSRIEPEAVVARPALAVTRPVLHDALVRALPASVDVHLGAPVASIDVDGDSARVTCERGAAFDADLVIGADGIHSRTRALTCGEQALRYSGTTCWRGLTKNPGITAAIEAWAGAARVGAVPLCGGELYYFLVLCAPARAPTLAWPADLQRAFSGLRGPAAEVLAALAEAPPLHHDLWELERPCWGKGRVLLLGDAAHAMTPNQGQGAAMAIEDACALALALGEGQRGILERYRALRHKRVRRVQMQSRRFGQVAHWTSPLAQRLRNRAMRAGSRGPAARHYRALVEPGLSLARAAA